MEEIFVVSKFLKANDMILLFNSMKINNLNDLFEAKKLILGDKTKLVIFRN